MRIKTRLFLLYILVVTFSSCSLFQSEISTVVDLLPRDSDVPGWVRINSVNFYKGKNIKKYNSEYLGLGIDRIASSVYQSIDDKDVKIKLEVISFNSVSDAYSFFSTVRGPGIFDISEVNEFCSDTVTIIQSGEYVISSTTDKAELFLKKELKAFVHIPLLYIGQNYNHDKLPAGLNIIKGSDGYGVLYSRKPYPQFPFLSNINSTRWTWNKELIDVFLSENNSFYDAYEIFKNLTQNDYILISSDNTYTAFRKEKDEKYTFISLNDKWIFGCWSLKNYNDGKKVLNELKSRIEDYNNRKN